MPERTKTKKIKFFRNMHLANKITMMYGSLFAVIIVLLSIFLMMNAWYYYTNLSKGELEQTIEKITEYIHDGGVISDEALKELNPNRFIGIRVSSIPDGKYTAPYRENIYFPVPPPESFSYGLDDTIILGDKNEAEAREPDNHEFAFRKGDTLNNPRIRTAMQYMLAERMVEYNGQMFYIQLYRQNLKERQILISFGVIFIIVGLLSITAAFLIGRYISRAMLRPITNITQAAGRISIEDLSERINIDGPDDEVKQLAVTFNAMIERLEASFKKQNQFISDASHELRTPISVIQGYANLMDRWGKKDEAILQESIDSIKAETEHMGKLVKKLLFLAKAEQHKLQLQKMPLSLNLVAEDVMREAKVMDIQHNFVYTGQDEYVIYGDYDLIKQMMWVFLENSIKYTKEPPGNTELRIYGDTEKCYIVIKDDGIGIANEDIPYIFERFYRADKSRSKEVPGAGLGLSIAGWILKQHDAAANVKSVLGEGTEITLSFSRYKEDKDQ